MLIEWLYFHRESLRLSDGGHCCGARIPVNSLQKSRLSTQMQISLDISSAFPAEASSFDTEPNWFTICKITLLFLQFLLGSYLSRSMVFKHVYVWGVTRGNFRKPHSNSNLIGVGREGSGTWASCVLKAPRAIVICKPRLQITSLSECLGLSCVH